MERKYHPFFDSDFIDAGHGRFELIPPEANDPIFFRHDFVVLSPFCFSAYRLRRLLLRIQGQCLDLPFLPADQEMADLGLQIHLSFEHLIRRFLDIHFDQAAPSGTW